MKFKDHGDWLKVSLEDVGSIRFDETCRYGVRFDIKNGYSGISFNHR